MVTRGVARDRTVDHCRGRVRVRDGVERTAMAPVTAPMVFTTVGIIVGTGGFGWFDLPVKGEAASILVEATLVLVLFTDAIRIDLQVLRREAALPGRLLGVGLPLTIAAGAVGAVVIVPGLSWAEAALLAAVLAPTDAALGQAVVNDRRLPARLRQALNVESGLNDGIAVPVVTVLLALVAAEEAGGAADWVGVAARQVGFGVLVGVAAGALAGSSPRLEGQGGRGGRRVPPAGYDCDRGGYVRRPGVLDGERLHRSIHRRALVRTGGAYPMQRRPGLHRGRGRAAQRDHVRALRCHCRRPRPRRAHLADRRLRGGLADRDPDGPGADRHARIRNLVARPACSWAGSGPGAWLRSCSHCSSSRSSTLPRPRRCSRLPPGPCW